MNYHEFALRGEPGVCACCGITGKQLQDEFLYSTFGDIHIEYIGRYFVPVCEKCSNRITNLGRYITSGYYKKELKPPYTMEKIISKYLDTCVEEGFFLKMASIAQAKLMQVMSRYNKKNRSRNPGPKEYDTVIKKWVDTENHKNEYIQIRLDPSHWESAEQLTSNGMRGDREDGSFIKKQYVVTDVYFYLIIEGKKDDAITHTKLLYP